MIMPSVMGLVADWTIFDKNPEIASSSTWVKPSAGSTVSMGDNCNWADDVPCEGVLKAVFKIEEKSAAPIMIVSPIRAFLMVNLAWSKVSGLPDEVIYKYPPLTRKRTAAAEAKINSVFKV